MSLETNRGMITDPSKKRNEQLNSTPLATPRTKFRRSWGQAARSPACSLLGVTGFAFAVAFGSAPASALTPGSHASTYGGNPVACAASLATLDVIAEENLLENATRMGEKLRGLLGGLVDRHAHALEPRGRGLMNGLRVRETAKPLQKACIERGLLATALDYDTALQSPQQISLANINTAFGQSARGLPVTETPTPLPVIGVNQSKR